MIAKEPPCQETGADRVPGRPFWCASKARHLRLVLMSIVGKFVGSGGYRECSRRVKVMMARYGPIDLSSPQVESMIPLPSPLSLTTSPSQVRRAWEVGLNVGSQAAVALCGVTQADEGFQVRSTAPWVRPFPSESPKRPAAGGSGWRHL